VTQLRTGWTILTLRDVAEWGSGGTPKATVPSYYGGDIPWAVIGDLNDSVVTTCARSITDDGLKNSSAKLLPKGAILIAMYGSIGKLGIAGKRMATNQAIAFAVARQRIIAPRYLFWYLRSQRQPLLAAGKGATQQNISQTLLKSWRIPVAPLPEQFQVVDMIEEQFSRLDAADAALRRAARNLTRLRRRALTKLFDKPWPIKPLNNLIDKDRPICYGILMPKEHIENGVPYIRVKDFPSGRIVIPGLRRTAVEIAEKYRRSTLRTGDVLVSIRGSYGKVAIVPTELAGANITQDTARISPSKEVLPEFIAAFLRSEQAQRFFREVARGVAVKGVNIGDLRRLKVHVPPLETQQEIVYEVERQLSVYDHMATQIALALRRSSQLRNAYLHHAFEAAQLPPGAPRGRLAQRIRE
jgi:type I restriction enzyme S subunit